MSNTSRELRGRARKALLAAMATSDDKDQQQLFERFSAAYAARAEMEEWLEGESALKVTLAQVTLAQAA